MAFHAATVPLGEEGDLADIRQRGLLTSAVEHFVSNFHRVIGRQPEILEDLAGRR
jgi:hypothetical protein